MITFLRRFVAVSLLVASAPAPAQEQPWVGAFWYIWKTDQGCLFYHPAVRDDAYYANNGKARKTWYFSITWEGSPCTPGKLINGTGTLVEVGNLAVTTGKPGRSINRRAGTMVNGLWNGTLIHSDVYPDGSATYPPRTFTMGCYVHPTLPPPCNPPRPPAELLETQR